MADIYQNEKNASTLLLHDEIQLLLKLVPKINDRNIFFPQWKVIHVSALGCINYRINISEAHEWHGH